MIDFLKKCDLTDNEIKEIEEVNSDANLYNLNSNEFDVIKMIDYLRKIGIKNIKEILMYNIDVFFNSFDEFKDRFNKKDKKIMNMIIVVYRKSIHQFITNVSLFFF